MKCKKKPSLQNVYLSYSFIISNILRLKHLEYTNIDISSSFHSSHNTVQEVLSIAEALNIKWLLDDDFTNIMLEAVLYPERHKKTEERMMPDYLRIHHELVKKGVTLSLLWIEYCMEAENTGKKPYMNTQFNDNYHKWAHVTKTTMRIQHKPGDAMEVDWAGATIDIYDNVTGEVSPAYLFVAVLSCSCYVYTEICINMKSDTFINCHVHARVKHPDDKPNAEESVRFATTWILAAFRNYRFFSIEEARAAVFEKLEELNTRPFYKRTGNPMPFSLTILLF